MPKAKDPDGKELSREETVDALLRRIAAYTVVLKRQVTGEDYKRLKTLRAFLKAANKLMVEIGDQNEK
jgi:predicted AAA+ superfamily ATPase